MMFLWYPLAAGLTATLGPVDGTPSLYHALYGAFVVALSLAIINGLLATTVSLLLYLKIEEKFLTRIAEGWTATTVWLQIGLGTAPLLLIGRALSRGMKWSLAGYGLPLTQLLIIVFCLYFQFRILKVYRARRQAGSSPPSSSPA